MEGGGDLPSVFPSPPRALVRLLRIWKIPARFIRFSTSGPRRAACLLRARAHMHPASCFASDPIQPTPSCYRDLWEEEEEEEGGLFLPPLLNAVLETRLCTHTHASKNHTALLYMQITGECQWWKTAAFRGVGDTDKSKGKGASVRWGGCDPCKRQSAWGGGRNLPML